MRRAYFKKGHAHTDRKKEQRRTDRTRKHRRRPHEEET